MTAYKILKVNGGIIALVDLAGIDVLNINDKDVSIHLADYGLLIKIGDIQIPITESLFEFISNNRNVTIYHAGIENYIEEPALLVELSKESLIEAKGIYSFWKKSLEEERIIVN